MSEEARLYVYRAIDAFEGPDRRYWDAYLAALSVASDRHGARFRTAFRDLLGFRDDDVIVDAWVKHSRGTAYLSPFYEKLGYDELIPDIVAALPEHLRRHAARLVEVPRIAHLYHRRSEPHQLPSEYAPPAAFLAFAPSERRRCLRPKPGADERGYVSRVGQVRARLARLRPTIERTGRDDALLSEVDMLTSFLAPHPDGSIVEYRYRAGEEAPGREAEEESIACLRARVLAARRGVLFARGLISVPTPG